MSKRDLRNRTKSLAENQPETSNACSNPSTDPRQNPMPILTNLGFPAPVLVIRTEGPDGGLFAFPIH